MGAYMYVHLEVLYDSVIMTLFAGSDSQHLFDLPFSRQIALLLGSNSAKCVVSKDRF